MPGRNGRGPAGLGPGSGRGAGFCGGYGRGEGRRFVRRMGDDEYKNILKEDAAFLGERLAEVNAELKKFENPAT